MARIINRPVIVETDGRGQPRAFAYRGRRYEVAEILEDWRELGPWWEQDPPEERTVYRVQVVGGVARRSWISASRPAGGGCTSGMTRRALMPARVGRGDKSTAGKICAS
ncbi:MAG TPA: DUF6504 family protein, partial [Thermaerobacter sp.]